MRWRMLKTVIRENDFIVKMNMRQVVVNISIIS